MSGETPPPDLGALSAKLREDDEQFRRTFALGQLHGEAVPAAPPPAEPGGAADLKARLLALVEARTGLDAAGGAGDRVERLLAAMPAAAVPSWLSALDAEPTEGPGWTTLIDSLTVNETYFFRDPDQLDFIRGQVLSRLIAARLGEARPRLTCWCAGCSSGEEVYTLAMLIVEALREAGEAELRGDGRVLIHPRWRITVLGTDLDRLVLRDAQAGRYADFPMGPFRSLPEPLFGYFEPPTPGAQAAPVRRVVRPELRALTAFHPFNLTAPEPPTHDVNLILCRNVLIYLSDRARGHAQALFHRALGADGALALGPTDVLRRPDLFQPVWGPATVIYRKK